MSVASLYKQNVTILWVGMLSVLVLAGIYVCQPYVVRLLDYKLFDTLLHYLPPPQGHGFAVIVDIDEKSLAELGQWPWPRYRVAALLEKIQNAGALSIALDMVFPEPDRTSLEVLEQEIERDLGIDIRFQNVPESLKDNDAVLAQTLADGPFVLGYQFLFGQQRMAANPCRLHAVNCLWLGSTDGGRRARENMRQANDVTCNLSAFSQAVDTSGFINALPDPDGVMRRVPLLLAYDEGIYPNLALAALLKALNANQIAIRAEAAQGIDALLIENTEIPLNTRGDLLLRPYPKTYFDFYSASDILAGKIPKAAIEGRIVIIGSTATGLKDIYATSQAPTYPGVAVQATIIDNILKEDFLKRPLAVRGAELLMLVALGIISTMVMTGLRGVWSVAFSILGLMGVWLWALMLFRTRHIYMSPLMPGVALFWNFALLSALKYIREERRLKARNIELAGIHQRIVDLLKSTNDRLGHVIHPGKRAARLDEALGLVEDMNHNIMDSLHYAARIQRSLLPAAEETAKWLNGFIIYQPRDIVSGDIFFSMPVKNGYVVAVIDCTGHGIPGAFLTMIAMSGLHQIVVTESCRNPAEVLGRLNVLLKTTLRQNTTQAVSDDGLEMSFCLVDHRNRKLVFAGARLSLVYGRANEFHILKGDKQVLGYKQSKKADIHFKFTNHEIELNMPLSCYLYTDGLTDQLGGPERKPFGRRRFIHLLEQSAQLPQAEQREMILREFEDYMGENERLDDVTVIGFQAIGQ